jgi:hypothetical protein
VAVGSMDLRLVVDSTAVVAADGGKSVRSIRERLARDRWPFLFKWGV